MSQGAASGTDAPTPGRQAASALKNQESGSVGVADFSGIQVFDAATEVMSTELDVTSDEYAVTLRLGDIAAPRRCREHCRATLPAPD